MAMAGTAVGAAVIAGSAALLGFGLDSGIEAPACIIVIWRFTRTRLGTRPRTGPATSGQAGKPPSPRAPSRTTFSARAPNPGSPSQGNPGLRKITRSLSPDRATCGWTGQLYGVLEATTSPDRQPSLSCPVERCGRRLVVAGVRKAGPDNSVRDCPEVGCEFDEMDPMAALRWGAR
jgi:hypothetical protein